MPEPSLPKAFEDLDRFVSVWALPTEVERNRKRLTSSMDVLTEFYDAVLPRFGEIMSYLKDFPAGELPPPERCLFELGLSFIEVSNSVERFGQPEIPDSFDAARIRVIGGANDVVAGTAPRDRGA